MRKQIGLLFIALLLTCCAHIAAHAQVTPLPRIAPRAASPSAEFYDTASSGRFLPEGNNYTKLVYENDQQIYNVTFNAGVYNASAADNALGQMRYDGYNVVRILFYEGKDNGPYEQRGQYGIGGPVATNTAALYQPYMDNVIDFLRRANANHVYVIPVLSYLPFNTYYQTLLDANQPVRVTGQNTFYMSQSAINAKKQYVQNFIAAIKAADPNLLSTIFAYELQNEVLGDVSEAPFSLTSGTVTTADGGTYDMADPASRQNCFDANVVNWANQLAATIRAEDPAAMVSASVFTFQAVGKAGPNGLLPRNTSQIAFPARPLILGLYANGLSYLDLHLYPLPNAFTYSIANDLNSSEFPAIDKTSKPLLMGEFGASAPAYGYSISSAAYGIKAHRQAAYDRGFAGSLYWTWDNPANSSWQPFYSCSEQGGSIDGQLAPILRITASNSYPTNRPYAAVDGDLNTWWGAGAFAPQWIDIDLGKMQNVTRVRLNVAQYPAGYTVHNIYLGTTPDELSYQGTLAGNTQDGQWLELTFPATSARYLRVETTYSPSWVAWREIIIN